MRRVAVVGSGGVGKSTFSKELSRRIGIPLFHLDEHFWKPEWVPTSRDLWEKRQVELFSGEEWIADGNYEGTFDLRFSRADTVIVLSLPRWRCLLRVVRRAMRNRGHDIQARGCPERLDSNYLRWVWRYPITSRRLLDQALGRHWDHLQVIELDTPFKIDSFLNALI